MSDEEHPIQTDVPAPVELTDGQVRSRLAMLEKEMVRLKTNPNDRPTTVQCNVCGDVIADGKRCPKHPNDKLNHVRDDMVLAKQV